MKQRPGISSQSLSPLLLLSLIVLLFIGAGCSRTLPVTPTPPAPAPIPAPVDTTKKTAKKDTVWTLATLEEIDSSRGPSPVHTNRFYRFYYDSLLRVTAVGISNFDGVLVDTSTCRIFYNGSSMKPSMIIVPIMSSPPAGSANYDTTWFWYNSSNQIQMDSSIDHTPYEYPNPRQPLKRLYSYPNAYTTLIEWQGEETPDGTLQLIRTDSIVASGSQLQTLTTRFYIPITHLLSASYDHAHAFQYSRYVNPLARLNIGGTVFSLIYSPVKLELFGNWTTKAVWNSNIVPTYLDFYSPLVPSIFSIGGYYSSDYQIGPTEDIFDIRVTADSAAPQFPRQISVGATTALEGRFIYKYSYWSKIE